MNFIDYCIATKNYSALSAVNEYSKMFGHTNPLITDPDERHKLAERLNEIRKEKDPGKKNWDHMTAKIVPALKNTKPVTLDYIDNLLPEKNNSQEHS